MTVGRFDDVVDDVALVFGAPVRVLVGGLPHEVAPLLAEVDAATRAGLLGGRVRRLRGGARARPFAVEVREPVEGLPLAWFALTEPPAGSRQPPLAERRIRVLRAERVAAGAGRPTAIARTSSACGPTSAPATSSRQPDRPADARRSPGTSRSSMRDLVHNQRTRYGAYLELGSHVVASASPELFFEWAGDTAADPADEGHGALAAGPRRGPAGRGRAGRQHEGAGREHHRRRPAPQRRQPGRRRSAASPCPCCAGRALRDGLAADLGRGRGGADRRRRWSRCSARCSRAAR